MNALNWAVQQVRLRRQQDESARVQPAEKEVQTTARDESAEGDEASSAQKADGAVLDEQLEQLEQLERGPE